MLVVLQAHCISPTIALYRIPLEVAVAEIVVEWHEYSVAEKNKFRFFYQFARLNHVARWYKV